MADNAQMPIGPITRMRACLDTLDGVFLRMASWFMQLTPENIQVEELTTGKIAAKLGISGASVVRFCYKLGYPNFASFKMALMVELLDPAASAAAESRLNYPPAASKVIERTLPSMSLTLKTINPALFNRAVEAMCRASMVIWYGFPGDSAHLAMSGEHKMTRSSLRARATTDIRELEALTRIISPGDVVIAISQSGRWEGAARAMEEFRKRHGTIICITGQADSVMARAADIILLTAARDISLGGEPLALRAAQLMLIDMLVLEVASRLQSVSLEWIEPKAAPAK